MAIGLGDIIKGLTVGPIGYAGYKAYKSGAFDPQTVSSLDPTQQKLYQQYADAISGKGPFADIFGYDPEGLRELFQQQYAQPAYQQFQESVVPGITGAFRGENLGQSSYAGNALAKAGRDVQSGLDAQLAQILYDAQQASQEKKFKGIQDILGMQTFAYQESPLMQLINAIAGGAGKAAGAAAFG